mgnify:CR=1 FL=1
MGFLGPETDGIVDQLGVTLDERGNVRHGTTEVHDCDRCVVVGEGGIAAAIGLKDMVVVHAHGATLACPLDQSEKVRRVSEAVRARGAS